MSGDELGAQVLFAIVWAWNAVSDFVSGLFHGLYEPAKTWQMLAIYILLWERTKNRKP